MLRISCEGQGATERGAIGLQDAKVRLQGAALEQGDEQRASRSGTPDVGLGYLR